MQNIEESHTSEDIFRETNCSVKFRQKIQKGNNQFNESSYSKGFFAKNEDSDWIDQKMLQMNMYNQDTKENVRPNSVKSKQSTRKRKQKGQNIVTEQSELENNSKVVLNKNEQNKKRKSTLKVISNVLLDPTQQVYFSKIRQKLPENSFVQCLIKRNKSFLQSKISLIYKNEELLGSKKSEGLLLGNKFDLTCLTLSNKKVATLKSNFMGSTFNLYLNNSQHFNNMQIATIFYKQQDLFSLNPRNVQMFLLKDLKEKFQQNTKNLKERYQLGETSNIMKLATKKAFKNCDNKYYLNFSNQQTEKQVISSVKNTILQDQVGKQSLSLMKLGQNQFKLVVKPPLSVLTAYAFTISSLVFKFASQ